jgi:hypothetical protein
MAHSWKPSPNAAVPRYELKSGVADFGNVADFRCRCQALAGKWTVLDPVDGAPMRCK